MINEQDDILIINSILENDNEAQRIFYDKYRQILTNYILSKYPHNLDVEDDVSEILIKVFTNLYKYNSEKAGVKTWVFAIAKNYMIDKFRRNDALTGSITIDGSSITIGNFDGAITSDCVFVDNGDNMFHTSTYGVAEMFENCDAVNFVSNNLSACDFSFLDMKYSQGFNYEEIGSEFNLTSHTVSNRVHYIKGKLKEQLLEEME